MFLLLSAFLCRSARRLPARCSSFLTCTTVFVPRSLRSLCRNASLRSLPAFSQVKLSEARQRQSRRINRFEAERNSHMASLRDSPVVAFEMLHGNPELFRLGDIAARLFTSKRRHYACQARRWARQRVLPPTTVMTFTPTSWAHVRNLFLSVGRCFSHASGISGCCARGFAQIVDSTKRIGEAKACRAKRACRYRGCILPQRRACTGMFTGCRKAGGKESAASCPRALHRQQLEIICANKSKPTADNFHLCSAPRRSPAPRISRPSWQRGSRCRGRYAR